MARLMVVVFPRRFAPLCSMLLMLSIGACAQLTNVSNDQATPIPGVGHDYIGMLSEMVNPASGSVSLRIQTPVPKGRLLSLPFSFAYDSNAMRYLQAQPAGAPVWSQDFPNLSPYLTKGGWSYTVPMLGYSVGYKTVSGGGHTSQCGFVSGYMFQEPGGGQHALHLAIAQPTGPGLCAPGFGGYSVLNGGDDLYLASTSGSWGANITTNVAAANGTVYHFVGNYSRVGILPSYVEDRNGNKITSTDNGQGAFSFTDTIGRVVISSSSFASSTGDTITIAGLPNTYSVTWKKVSSNFTTGMQIEPGSYCSPITSDTQQKSVISSITLPNGHRYTFLYGTDDSSNSNPYGLLSKIVYPSGGWVKYSYGQNTLSEYFFSQNTNTDPNTLCNTLYGRAAVTKRTVSFDGTNVALQQTFTYSTTWNNPTYPTFWTAKQTVVSTHDFVTGRVTETDYSYSPISIGYPPNYGAGSGPQVALEQTTIYKDVNSAVVRTTTKGWFDQYEAACALQTLDTGAISGEFYTYGSGAQLTDRKEYDYGLISSTAACPASWTGSTLPPSATPTRETAVSYASFAATPIFPVAPSLFDRPSTMITYGNGIRVAESDYAYDQAAVGSVSSLVSGTHDETNYGAGSTVPRGNATTITNVCFPSCANAVTTSTFDETGQMLTTTDPCGNATCSDMTVGNHKILYSYADNYTLLSGGQNVPYTPTAATNALLTLITDALGHTQNFSYDFKNEQLTILKDQNGQTTTFLYNDPFARPTQANYPDSGLINYLYSDVVGNVNVEKKKNIDGTRTTDEFSYHDGMGHQISHSTANGESVPWDKFDTCFDGLGHVMFVSYPHQATSAAPAGGCPSEAGDSFGYDSLSRVTSIKHSDNSLVSTSYTGRATDVLDEGNGTRRIEKVSQVDGLGRLVSVCEVTTSTQLGPGGTPATCIGQDIAKTGFLTTYSYDVLGNLLTVAQGALTQRSFTYDSLSRLLTATNPESSTTCNGTWSNNQCVNGYDVNSNLTYRTRPAPNQTNPATTVRTTYQYDPLNRVTQRAYSGGVTPTATFIYDQIGTITIAGQSFPISNSIGRVTSNCTGPTSSCLTEFAFSYDSVGRVNQQEQFVSGWSGAFPVTYTYDLLGNETGDGTNLVDAWTYNVAGRLATFSHTAYNGPGEPANLLTNAHYDAYGHLISAALGDGLSQSWAYDPRGRVQSAAVGTNCSGGSCSGSTVYRYTVGYAPNSDVTSSTDTVNGTWTYTQDDLNRLASSSCTANCPNNSSSQSFTYRYDRYSNRWQQNAPQGGPQPLYTFSGSNNRLDGLSYDAVGNLRNDGNHSYTYDAENRIVSVDNGAATYVYDAEGRRVQQKIGSQTCSSYYDQKGRVVIRTDATCATFQRYAYVGNVLLGTYTNYAANQNIAPFFYAHGDWVGTERARVDSTTGTACQTVVSLPFGDGQTVRGTCGTVTSDLDFHHFTGKERDAESNLDNFGARYNASSLGRFMTADDPLLYQDRNDPQSLNLYSYVRNNPLSRVDPDGHLTIIVPGTGWSPSDWNMNMKLISEAKEQFHDSNVRILPWTGALGGDAIKEGAQQLREMVAGYSFAPGEGLNVITHSRGIEVALEASDQLTHAIDNLITLAPIKYCENCFYENVRHWDSITAMQDWVQSGYSPAKGGFHQANNFAINAFPYGHIESHSQLWQNESIRKMWWSWWSTHQCVETWDAVTNTLRGCL